MVCVCLLDRLTMPSKHRHKHTTINTHVWHGMTRNEAIAVQINAVYALASIHNTHTQHTISPKKRTYEK